MKSGFNHRKISSAATMFIALLLLISTYGCRTSKSVVEKHKENFSKEELQLNKFDSLANVIKTNNITNFDSITWSTYFNQYDISYSGTLTDDFGTLEKIENGFKFTGKLNVSLKGSESKGDSIKLKEQSENINENTSIKSNSKNELKSNESKSNVDKKKENKSTGFNWNLTILLIIIGSLALVLLWKFGLPKFRKR
ncbi:hypothetical protein HX001_14495 [Empedobacter brevis]|uniref:Lipoprotein n=1 Tax=Empedobacter brevis TaxID=247 RepID=A0AAJ1QGK9_9FLAO|nr:hypothetical protein [Empedobacter brevis]MDM1073696.1 hypothetical protein [Empedobacter brevis]